MFCLDFMEPRKNPRWPPKSQIFAISQYFVGQTYKCDTSLIIFFKENLVMHSKQRFNKI